MAKGRWSRKDAAYFAQDVLDVVLHFGKVPLVYNARLQFKQGAGGQLLKQSRKRMLVCV